MLLFPVPPKGEKGFKACGFLLPCDVITGRKPKQKMYLLESLKWRQSVSGVPNFLERLLGAARLLSQMVEPILKAATYPILLNVASLSNTVSSLAQNKQSVKINKKGIDVGSPTCVFQITDNGGDIEKMEVDHPDKEGSSLMKKDEDLSAGSPTQKEIEHQKQAAAADASIAVKRPSTSTSTSNVTTPGLSRGSEKEADGMEDSFFDLLTAGGNLKSLF
ncbi:unnamed protein product [Linum tenue]|uniref:Uncharacterized protein n=1 Tax=Linum tenue TaxID=586396 RepID=A0AAV0H4Y6_9ROSI|nr:unnamed protein product [Linum tenue]